jgi:hypothetical protein
MVVRITIMIMRLLVLVQVVLGILFWVGTALGLVGVHMLLGLLVGLCLWVLAGVAAFNKDGNIGLAVVAFVWAIIMVALGLTQQTLLVGSLHWIIDVIHLLVGLLALGFGEMIAGRYRRHNAPAVQATQQTTK